MSFNLVDLIKDQVNGQVIGQISNAVGESPEATKSVIESAIPAILGGLMSKASSDDDAGSVLEAVTKQDDSVLDNFSGLVASAKKDALVESGKHTVGSLLGGESAVGLVSAISSAASVDQSKTNSIVGMITPVVMSTVKRFMAGGGDVSQAGLTNMLLSQKENIASALPTALTEKLGASDLLGSFGGLVGGAGAVAGLAGAASSVADNVKETATEAVDDVTSAASELTDSATASVTDAVDSAKSAASDLADSAKDTVTEAAASVSSATESATDTVAEATSGSSWIKKLIPIIILAVLAIFGYKYFAGAAMEQTAADSEQAPVTEEVATPELPEAPATPELPDAPATPELPDAPELPGAPATPELPDAPSIPSTDVVSDAVDASKGLADKATEGVTGAISGLSGVVAGGGDLTNQLKGLFDTAQTSLGSITDVESAETALPVLTDFNGKLDGITAMADKLPEAAKPVFNSVVQGGLGQLNPMLDRAMAIPGVGAVLGGVIEPLKEKLAGLAGE